MSHYAEVDERGNVLRVIVAEKDFIDSGAVGDPSRWVQTSYNRSFRKNFAGIGFTYDKVRDVFIPPKTFPSWKLDESTANWKSPKPHPNNGKPYHWDESKQEWIDDSAIFNRINAGVDNAT